jgi:tRNA threonylcarbamoyladenosine biosynthesis protein TsaB
MKILAWETSSTHQSVCLQERGNTLWQVSFVVPRRETGPLFSYLEEALRHAGGAVDALVVGTGPGSYNGLRVGLAAGHGLRQALGCRLLGMSSLLGLPAASYEVAGDARGQQFFLARVHERKFVQEPHLVAKLPREAEHVGPRLWIGEAPPCGWQVAFPQAASLAGLAEMEEAEPRDQSQIEEPGIIYLKPPHITAPKRAFSVAADETDR